MGIILALITFLSTANGAPASPKELCVPLIFASVVDVEDPSIKFQSAGGSITTVQVPVYYSPIPVGNLSTQGDPLASQIKGTIKDGSFSGYLILDKADQAFVLANAKTKSTCVTRLEFNLTYDPQFFHESLAGTVIVYLKNAKTGVPITFNLSAE